MCREDDFLQEKSNQDQKLRVNRTVETVFNTLGSANRLTNCVKSKDYHKKDERGSFKNPDSGHEILLGGRPGCFKLSGRGVWIPSWSRPTKEPTGLCSQAAPNGTEAGVSAAKWHHRLV